MLPINSNTGGNMVKPNDHEQRHFSRISFHADVQLHFTLSDFVQAAILLDISLKGALIETLQPVNPDKGNICSLTLSLSEVGEYIIMEGKVVHHRGNNIGIECQHIDMDSMINLRRLVELNLGEPGLLERELTEILNPRYLN